MTSVLDDPFKEMAGGVVTGPDFDRLILRALNLGILTAESLCEQVNNPPQRVETAHPSTLALKTLWRELAAGTRTLTTFDALWRAACAEQAGLDAMALRMDDAAARDFARAADVLREAAA